MYRNNTQPTIVNMCKLCCVVISKQPSYRAFEERMCFVILLESSILEQKENLAELVLETKGQYLFLILSVVLSVYQALTVCF